MVLRVSDPRVPGADGDRVRVVVLAKSCANLAEPGHDGARAARVVGLDHLDVALLRIGDPVVTACRVDGDAPWPVESWLSARARVEAARATLSKHRTGGTRDDQPLIDGVHGNEICGCVEADAADLVVQRGGAVARADERIGESRRIRVSAGGPCPLLDALT